MQGGRACRKGQAKGKAVSNETLDRVEEYDSLIGDHFTDYKNELYGQLIRVEKGIMDYSEIKAYSFYRYLRTKSEALAGWYLRNDYDLRDETYTILRKIKRRKAPNDEMDSRE